MGMEDDTRAFLVLIINTIALILIWMIANVLVGIYMGYAFFEGSPGWKNILYYICTVITLILIVRRLRRQWDL